MASYADGVQKWCSTCADPVLDVGPGNGQNGQNGQMKSSLRRPSAAAQNDGDDQPFW